MSYTPIGDFAPRDAATGDASTPDRWRGLALGLLLGGVIVGAWVACERTHARRRSHRSAAAPAPVQDWENEGGAPDPCAN